MATSIYQIGDKVKHNWFDDVATVTAKREAYTMGSFQWLYTLDFGHSVKGPFGKDYNGEEFLEEAIKPLQQPSEITEMSNAEFAEQYCKPDIIKAAKMGVSQCLSHNGKEIRIRMAYKNGHDDPTGWTYCVTWYQGKELRECDNGVTLNEAALDMALFKRRAAKGWTLEEILYGKAA